MKISEALFKGLYRMREWMIGDSWWQEKQWEWYSLFHFCFPLV